jgi:hypothetical protein
MKTFYSAEDIENFANQGQKEICVDEGVILTDLAKQTAHMLGIRITEKPSATSTDNFIFARPRAVGKTHTFSGKPKGCQRRPAQKPARASGAPAGKSQPIVEKLVEKVKRISGLTG